MAGFLLPFLLFCLPAPHPHCLNLFHPSSLSFTFAFQPPCHDPSSTPCSVADSPYTFVYIASSFYVPRRLTICYAFFSSLSAFPRLHRVDRNRISLRCSPSAAQVLVYPVSVIHAMYSTLTDKGPLQVITYVMKQQKNWCRERERQERKRDAVYVRMQDEER